MSENFDALMGDSTDRNQVLYEDSCMRITDKDIEMKWYIFPLGTKKVIPLRKVKSFKVYQPRRWYEMKSWGMGADFQVWWNCDMRRQFGDRHAIVLNTGEWPNVGMTPGHGKADEVRKVQRILNRYIEQDT